MLAPETLIGNDEARRLLFEIRMELLEQISQCVAGSLNIQELLCEVSNIIAPKFADWLTVDLMKEERLERIFIHHSEQNLQGEAEIFRAEFEHDVPTALLDILKTGNPIFIPIFSEQERETFSISEHRWNRLQELGIGSVIMVPLRSRRRTLGVIGFDYGHSNRHYSANDVDFAIEIASRIATGIDNALLLAEAKEEIKRRTELQCRLEEAKEQAEVANRAKDQFIATLSHELRTPLTPVLATVELLAEDPDFPEAMIPSLDLIRRNIEIEARLIDDLLDMTRVAKGKLRFIETDVDLHALIPEVIEISQPDFDRGKLRLVTRLRARNAFVHGDRDRLSQVLWNVLHNAAKFTPNSGVITIRTSNDTDHGILIEVADTGCGIEPTKLKQIFDPFEQLAYGRAESHSYGGLGLGLAISKSIVEMHGGTIEAQSKGAGHGTTFTIHLVAIQHTGAGIMGTRHGGILPHRGESGRILMVDDHADTNAAIKVLLERRGYTVTTASTVASGLELARLHPFDILVSDIGLPDGDGIDLLRAIHADERISPRMNAIAVSGYGTEADVDRSLRAGFKHHLRKPIAFPDLERAIAQVLAEK